MDSNTYARISIQVCLNGYSFKVEEGGEVSHSDWLPADKMFTTAEFQRRYDSVELSLLTPKVALVPSVFSDRSAPREMLSKTVLLDDADKADIIAMEEYQADLVYSLSVGEVLSGAIAQAVSIKSGMKPEVFPEMYYILKSLRELKEHNRIVASFADGHLHLAIAQGNSLLMANVFDAMDFTTAEYFIFLALKKLQLNPEASVIHFRTPLSESEEMSLYRYFKAVERI